MNIQVAITPALRAAVFRAWDNRCAYCRAADAEHLDHIFPRAKGGQNDLSNLVPACVPCNLRKKDLVLAEGFLRIMEAQATSKIAAVKGLLDAERAQSKPAPAEPRRLSLRPRSGEYIFDAAFDRRVIQILLQGRWRSFEGLKKASFYGEEATALRKANSWPYARWREIDTDTETQVSGVSNRFVSRMDDVGQRTTVELYAYTLPLLSAALASGSSVFVCNEWPGAYANYAVPPERCQRVRLLK
jgi:hypothetical protein